MEDGTERGQGSKYHIVRDKARLINILVSDFQQLEAEREAARQLSNRYVGISSDEYYTGGGRAGYASSAPSAYQPAAETVSQRSGLGAGQASSQWTPNSRGFESPQYSQPNRETQAGLFEPPRETQRAEGLFQPPRQPVQEYNIFDSKAQQQFKPQPVDSKPPTAPATDIFSLPSKPKTDLFSLPKPTPARNDPPADLFTLPKPTPAAKDPPADLFTLPKATPVAKDPPADLFTLPKPTQKNPPSDLFSIPKSQPKPTAPQVEPNRPAPPTSTPAVTANPTSNPSVISALDGLFTAQPTNKPGVVPKPGQCQRTVPQATLKIHHNMEASPVPTLSELKITPSLAQPATAPPPPKRKSGDLESFLIDLDNLKIEGSLDKRDNTHVEGFGVVSGKRA